VLYVNDSAGRIAGFLAEWRLLNVRGVLPLPTCAIARIGLPDEVKNMALLSGST